MSVDLPAQTEVLIAGAGIGGLTAALALHEQGIDALVLESSRDLRPLGVGINLQPQAVRALTALGLGDRLDEIAVADSGARYVTTSGVELAHRTFDPEHQQMAVHRGKLQMMLFDAVRERLPEGSVLTGKRVEGFVQEAGQVTTEVTDRHDEDSTHSVRSGVLVGADGVHSNVRLALHPDAGENHWEGTLMFRGTRRSEGEFLDSRTMVLAYGEAGKRFLAYPIFHDEDGSILINWVAMVPTSESKTISDEAMGNQAVSPADVLPHFDGWNLEWMDVEAIIDGSDDVLKYPMVDREPLDSWGTGSVTLLGDAAHPMYPIGANGGSQAIRDAVSLAQSLSGNETSREAGLSAYERERVPFTAEVVVANRRLNAIERRLAGLTQGRLEEMAHSGEFAHIQESYAKGEFENITIVEQSSRRRKILTTKTSVSARVEAGKPRARDLPGTRSAPP